MTTTKDPLPPFSPTAYRAYLNRLNDDIDARLCALGMEGLLVIGDTLKQRTDAIDAMLCQIFDEFLDSSLSLFAIGGYGRGELFARSDVDVLILGHDTSAHQTQIEKFVACLWDIGIEPAILVQDTKTLHVAMGEISFATATLEARPLKDHEALSDFLVKTLLDTWTLTQFYHAKINEAKARHQSHLTQERSLEPDLKTGMGGLRDIHLIGWLYRFYHHSHHPTTHPSTPHHSTLLSAQAFFWLIRHHLHAHTPHKSDRLAFDAQKSIATRLNLPKHPNNPNAQAQTLMRTYHHHATTTVSVSELLCEEFAWRCLDLPRERLILDDDFYQYITPDGAYIALQDLTLFAKKPITLLSIFLAMGKYHLKKIEPATLSALSLSVHQIDETYRTNPTHRAMFLANLQENNCLFHRLTLMARFGILGAYLPAFLGIMGLSQYDLFHRHTVDVHTLYLIGILHRFGQGEPTEYQQKFDLVSQIYQQIHRKDILAISALFHDIAKGQDGDHSELGAVEVHDFCISHGMTNDDSEFCAWLVRHHLTMSLVAQKKDIYDPYVIGEFARLVGSVSRLNHLYVLTVADMNATNSQLWNTWRASLLKQLYLSTHKVLTQGETDPTLTIKARKERAKSLMSVSDDADVLWAGFGDEYFLTQKSADIAWQTGEILTKKHTLNHTPIISLTEHSDLALDAILVFICVQDQANLFAKTVYALDKLGLSVLDANILTADIDGKSCALDSYIVIDRYAKRDGFGRLNSDFLSNQERQDELRHTVTQAIFGGRCQVVSTFEPATKAYVNIPTRIDITPATTSAHIGHHYMHLLTKDRPSLLAKVGMVFCEHGIKVHGARITTLGERAEDVFYISADAPLDEPKLNALKTHLITVLGQTS